MLTNGARLLRPLRMLFRHGDAVGWPRRVARKPIAETTSDCTDGGIRTHTLRVLSAPPLPLGYVSVEVQAEGFAPSLDWA